MLRLRGVGPSAYCPSHSDSDVAGALGAVVLVVGGVADLLEAEDELAQLLLGTAESEVALEPYELIWRSGPGIHELITRLV